MNKVRAHIKIKGLVQGVFFRANTCRAAYRYGVGGWVKNMADGSVEAVLEGDEGAVKKVIKWCRNGPPGAIVEDVEISWEKHTAEFNDFKVIV